MVGVAAGGTPWCGSRARRTCTAASPCPTPSTAAPSRYRRRENDSGRGGGLKREEGLVFSLLLDFST